MSNNMPTNGNLTGCHFFGLLKFKIVRISNVSRIPNSGNQTLRIHFIFEFHTISIGF